MKRNALTRKKRFAEQIKFLSWATALSEFVTLFLLLKSPKIQAFWLNFTFKFSFLLKIQALGLNFSWIATPISSARNDTTHPQTPSAREGAFFALKI